VIMREGLSRLGSSLNVQRSSHRHIHKSGTVRTGTGWSPTTLANCAKTGNPRALSLARRRVQELCGSTQPRKGCFLPSRQNSALLFWYPPPLLRHQNMLCRYDTRALKWLDVGSRLEDGAHAIQKFRRISGSDLGPISMVKEFLRGLRTGCQYR
jgi:hypothetical protein